MLAALLGLADQVRVGDVRAGQADQVGLARGDEFGGLRQAVQPAHRQHRQVGELPA